MWFRLNEESPSSAEIKQQKKVRRKKNSREILLSTVYVIKNNVKVGKLVAI